MAESGRAGRIALVGATTSDVRDVLVEGESGILQKSPPWFMPRWQASKGRLTWPNGAQAFTYSAEEPERLRGKQHDAAAADELASWKYSETWDQLMFGLRLGSDPRCVVSTTPRPTPIIRSLARRALDPNDVRIVKGSTYENKANLAKTFVDKIIRRYEGTRLGRQELYAEILDDNPGALWKRDQIDSLRVEAIPELVRVVVGVDPAVSNDANSDETGIVVAGLGKDGHGYVLDDRSLIASPAQWAKEVVAAYHSRKADRIVAEINNGGALVESAIRTVGRDVAYKGVHASRGKAIRAEPIAALYEQGRVHHVGAFAKLEDQLCQWDPAMPVGRKSRSEQSEGEGVLKSPDRLDALVWSLTELMLEGNDDDTELFIGGGSRR